jgi:DNA-directed RNA polymerase specialized sigma24 family protein
LLPAAEEQALRLKYYENRTDDEITAVMRVSRSTVGRYVRNGLDKISVPYEAAELIESLSSAEHDRE